MSKKTQAQRDVIARFSEISKKLLKEFTEALQTAAEADEEASEQPDEKPRSEMTLAERQAADVAARKAQIEEQSVVQSESTIELDDGKPTEAESKLIEYFTEKVHNGLADVQTANRWCDELNLRCRFTSKDQPQGFSVSRASLTLNEFVKRYIPEWKKALGLQKII